MGLDLLIGGFCFVLNYFFISSDCNQIWERGGEGGAVVDLYGVLEKNQLTPQARTVCFLKCCARVVVAARHEQGVLLFASMRLEMMESVVACMHTKIWDAMRQEMQKKNVSDDDANEMQWYKNGVYF